jgi:hypothetical protein
VVFKRFVSFLRTYATRKLITWDFQSQRRVRQKCDQVYKLSSLLTLHAAKKLISLCLVDFLNKEEKKKKKLERFKTG